MTHSVAQDSVRLDDATLDAVAGGEKLWQKVGSQMLYGERLVAGQSSGSLSIMRLENGKGFVWSDIHNREVPYGTK